MSAYWDFRSILDVYPDHKGFTCVAKVLKEKEIVRCTQSFLSESDLACASEILDEMAVHKNLSNSYKYLEELAELTLCPRWHRKPSHSQVQLVARQWQRTIADYAAKREREKMATSDSKRAQTEMRKNRVEYMAKLKDVDTDNISFTVSAITDLRTASSLVTDMAQLEGRVPLSSMKHAPESSLANITPPSSSKNTPCRIRKANWVENCDSEASISKFSYPLSPPKSPLDPGTLCCNMIEAEQFATITPTKTNPQQKLMITRTSGMKGVSTTMPNEATSITISKEKTKIETFNFDFPPTPDTTPQSFNQRVCAKKASQKFRAGNQHLAPAFDLGIAGQMPVVLAVTGKSLSGGSTKLIDADTDIHRHNFTPEHQLPSRSFNFSTTIQLSPFETDPFISTTENTSTSRPLSPKTVPVQTKLGHKSSEDTLELVEVDFNEPEETYGYVNSVSSSTCYKSYIPSRRHHLVTTPGTQEAGGKSLQDAFLAFISESSSFVVVFPEKTLPTLGTLQFCDPDAQPCGTCEVREDQCCCDDYLDAAGRLGCLQSLRLRKLGRKVAWKTKAAKKRLSGVLRPRSS